MTGKPVYKDIFRKVERVLYDYPLLAQRLAVLEQYLIARCNISEGYITLDSHGIGSSIEERVILAKEKDKEYQALLLKIEAVRKACEMLPDDLKRLVEIYYFKRKSRFAVMEELAISERSFYRLRKRALEYCAHVIGERALNAIA